MTVWYAGLDGNIEIKVHGKEMYVKLVIYEDYNEMHGQQNITFTYDGSQNPNRKPEINPLNAQLNPICHLLVL